MELLKFCLFFCIFFVFLNPAESVAEMLPLTQFLRSLVINRDKIFERYGNRLIQDGASGNVHQYHH